MGACVKCGTEVLENARFCHGCGAPVAQAETPAEYKQVTVLFADVVKSMDLAVAVGPERLREIMAELVDRCSVVVQRYGGTVDKFTGDGIMAVFGAPVALEDHALRACLAALGIHEQAVPLVAAVAQLDGIELGLRIGLNSGEVIAGEIGSGALGYTAVGEQVGMAQRMESVAPRGGVMLSDSTVRLVENTVTLGDPQLVRIKGAEQPVQACPLLGVPAKRSGSGTAHSTLVGREREMAALTAMLGRSIAGRGSVVGVMGPPGIGKTRLIAETLRLAESHGIEVFSVFCESHAIDVAFDVVVRLLRAIGHLDHLDDRDARALVRSQLTRADPQDLLILDDLLGIAEPAVVLPRIDPDARRRRLTALINAALLARTNPVVIVVEDLHWIDDVSESMLADFLPSITETRSMVLLTYRPEYAGVLQQVAGPPPIVLAPLNETETSALLADLLGPDPSVRDIGAVIRERSAGNPFFAAEIVRDLAERGVLVGRGGAYECRTDVGEVRVPATLQATIAARIDRLSPAAKQTLAAAAVIGSRFAPELLVDLGIDPSIDELIRAELVSRVCSTRVEYEFQHPLVRTVAYETQLKADRARSHRRLAAAIEARDPHQADQHAVLIAEHLGAAGDRHASYGWHMRAAAWAVNRDIGAAQLSWEHATTLADELPEDDPFRVPMRIAPRTMLCGVCWRASGDSGSRFEELRLLCDAAGDKGSLAIAMAGQVWDHSYQSRLPQASALASEAMELIESIGDPNLTLGLSIALIYAKGESSEWSEALPWLQSVIDLADGDPTKGNFLVGSPLGVALAMRGQARCFLGLPGWQDDRRAGLEMTGSADPMSYTAAAAYSYGAGIPSGVLLVDDAALRDIEDVVRTAERSSDDLALILARMVLGLALVHCAGEAERDRGRGVLSDVRDALVSRRQNAVALSVAKIYLDRERARRGDRDDAIISVRAGVEHVIGEGRLLGWGIPATGILVEMLLERAAADDLVEAEAAIERLAAATDDALPVRDILLLRLRALLAGARGDGTGYTESRDRYRRIAAERDFQGHVAWAATLP